MSLTLLVGVLAWLYAAPAAAYVGPGAGAGVIAVVIGVISSVVLAVVGIVWYPLKRMLRRRKEAAESRHSNEPDSR